MKTQFLRVSALVVAVSSLLICSGCEEERAQAEGPVILPVPTVNPTASADVQDPSPVLESPAPVPDGADAVPGRPPSVKVVQAPVPPEDVQSSPALAEVVKLVQAGVGDDVTLAYIKNSAQPFGVTSDQIVYLNDLGVSSTVMTSLIQHDTLPEVAARKTSFAAPLPAGVALTTPATNVYPASYAPPAHPAPVAPVFDPNAPDAYDTAPAVADEPPATPSYFYNSLSPYGSWIDVDGYGRCWQPTVAVASPTWRPYCDRGHWLWTDSGWYWYSDYSWGWAPFHYGRWCSYPRLGWFWVPDTCWGPSWVSWRYTSSYCGWAPLPPGALFVSGRGFFYHGHSVGLGFDFGLSASLHTFVPLGHFYDRNPSRYRVSGNRAAAIYEHSSVINNYSARNNGTVINHGLSVDRVAQAAGRKIPPVTIQHGAQVAAGRLTRHEQLQNNGSTLAVVRPPLTTSTTPANHPRATPAALRPNPLSASRVLPTARSARSNPFLTLQPAETGSPVLRAHQEKPAPLRQAPLVRPPISSAPAAPGTIAPAPSLRTSQPGGTVAATRTEKPANRSILIPPVGQRPISSPQPQPTRTANLTPPSGSAPEMYRVYAEPRVVPRPENPRFDSPAPQYGRPAASAPNPYRSQFGSGPGMAPPPTYHSDAGHAPTIRSEPAHSPPASHSAASQSSPPSAPRSGGGKKD